MTDLTGRIFGRLTVLSRNSRINRKQYWNCLCECGKTAIVRQNHLIAINHAIRSCGCLRFESRNTTHGLSHTRTYHIWLGIKKRCLDAKARTYKLYGARGITVCDRWLQFENFLTDIGECPEGLTIERKNNNGNYEPGNCKWATYVEQARNRRSSRIIEYNGIRQTLAAWSEQTGLHHTTILYRLKIGRSIEEALTIPVKRVS